MKRIFMCDWFFIGLCIGCWFVLAGWLRTFPFFYFHFILSPFVASHLVSSHFIATSIRLASTMCASTRYVNLPHPRTPTPPRDVISCFPVARGGIHAMLQIPPTPTMGVGWKECWPKNKRPHPLRCKRTPHAITFFEIRSLNKKLQCCYHQFHWGRNCKQALMRSWVVSLN